MSGVEVAAVALGTAVVKGACKVWLGNDKVIDETAAGMADLVKERITDHLDRRKFGRFLDSCADIVAARTLKFLSYEFRGLPDNERQAAIIAVHDVIDQAQFSDKAIVHADVDPLLLERTMRPVAVGVLKRAALSASSEELYRLLLRESCAYLVEVVTTFPSFQANALTEILRRETAIIETLRRVLDSMPERRGLDDFAADYCRQVINKLDRMELFGITAAEPSRSYPLSVAYVSLRVVEQRNPERIDDSSATEGNQPARTAKDIPVEEALNGQNRAFIIGEAGTGKTTLLHWLAVRAAEHSFPPPLSEWDHLVPFFIPLRQYNSGIFPAPEQFPTSVGRNITAEMPAGWVQKLLRQGQALVLIDGIDEMPENHRPAFRRWIRELVTEFPGARYVLTSRPAAVAPDGLLGANFTTIELQLMSPPSVQRFIHLWYQAVQLQLAASDERDRLAEWERALRATLEADRYLRLLAGTPLLCALLCALNRERRTQLPREPMEIYSAALDMLLARRDEERGVSTVRFELTRAQKVVMLQDFALWLVRNGLSEAPIERMIDQIQLSLESLGIVDHSPRDVGQYLLERSGLIREPTPDRVDFIHRTFQDYLAGRAAVRADDIGALIANAHNDLWRNVIIMAAGHASRRQCNELVHGLLMRGDHGRSPDRFRLLAIACVHPSVELDPELRQEIDAVIRQFVPPRDINVAQTLAASGEVFLDLIKTHPPQSAAEARATIRTVSLIGGQEALRLIAEIAIKFPKVTEREFLRAWRLFDPDEFGRIVLSSTAKTTDGVVEIADPDMMNALKYISALRGIRFDAALLPALPARSDDCHFQEVEIIECASSADLSPLLSVKDLRRLGLECKSSPPNIESLARAGNLRILEISCSWVHDQFQKLILLSQLERLIWRVNVGYYDLSALPVRPPRLSALHINGWRFLARISQIASWNGLTELRFSDCPILADLNGLESVATLETLILERTGNVDLAPLRALRQLRFLQLKGVKEISLQPISDMRDLTVEVPERAVVYGDDLLGVNSRVIRRHSG
jgi:NACHT domain